jgi:hypothetical protein
MKLPAYLKLTKKTVTQAAKELSINRQYMHCLLVGKNKPGRKLAMRIREWSQDAIGYDDMWE